MISDSLQIRQSDIAYILAKLRIDGSDYLLLRAHPKWGDWSLVGGHVEPFDHDWFAAAAREVAEEMAPLRYGEEVEVVPLDLPMSVWGPVPSVSAGGLPTKYRACWYALRFKTDPMECLSRLPPGEFCLLSLEGFQRSDDASTGGVSSIVDRVLRMLPGGWRDLPLAWGDSLEVSPLRGFDSSAPLPSFVC